MSNLPLPLSFCPEPTFPGLNGVEYVDERHGVALAVSGELINDFLRRLLVSLLQDVDDDFLVCLLVLFHELVDSEALSAGLLLEELFETREASTNSDEQVCVFHQNLPLLCSNQVLVLT